MQCLPTVLIPFAAELARTVEEALDHFGTPLKQEIHAALDQCETIHFLSMSVILDRLPECPIKPVAFLLLEASADGDVASALTAVAEVLRVPLNDLLRAARVEEQAPDLATFLIAHECGIGQGWLARTLGLPFAGTPGMSVKRIRREHCLAKQIADMQDVLTTDSSALSKLQTVREKLWKEGDRKWAFVAEPVPHVDVKAQSKIGAVGRTAPPVLAMLLWPALPFLALLVPVSPWLPVLVAIVVAVGLLAWLGHLERTDVPKAGPPDAKLVAAVMERENRCAQNLMVTVTDMKPGWFRLLAIRVVFVIIGRIAAHEFRPGFLADLGSIHFARWFLLPGSRRLVFVSNYDGSVESYLEDFIQEAHEGVSAIWSNTVGFMRTRWLFLDGARDGDRLRHFVLSKQIPIRFWYSAYPSLPTARIRANAEICRGIASANTDLAAENWLACFGASGRLLARDLSARPRAVLFNIVEDLLAETPSEPLRPLERRSIPRLMFGRRGRLAYSTSLMIRLKDKGEDDARAWLAEFENAVTFGDADVKEVLALAFAASAFASGKLALCPDDLASFSAPFLNGMAASCRARALGDSSEQHQLEPWLWGGPTKPVDVLALLFDTDPDRLRKRAEQMKERTAYHGHEVVYEIALKPLEAGGMTEPFGFADGLSQPLVRGFDRSPVNEAETLLETGEFVLGYPDNRGFLPPSPTVLKVNDPNTILPELDDCRQDLGRNGTYLAVRQLDQDVGAFDAWSAQIAGKLGHGDLGLCVHARDAAKKLATAKAVGRWSNGSSLAQHPVSPGRNRRNDFVYGSIDPSGLGCPLGAHVRRANPRDSFDPGSDRQLALANRHRILRIGRKYGPLPDTGNPGLLFMCLNADIGRQFEFVQQTWLLGQNFHGLEGEADPLLQPEGHGPRTFTVQTQNGPVRLKVPQSFVKVLGGGYYFMPSREALHFLSTSQRFQAV